MHDGILCCLEEGGTPAICDPTVNLEDTMLTEIRQTQRGKYGDSTDTNYLKELKL